MDKHNPIAEYVRTERKKLGFTQDDFALRTGLSLSFIRNLEQGKPTLRLDKVNQALHYFNAHVAPAPIPRPTPVVGKDGYYA